MRPFFTHRCYNAVDDQPADACVTRRAAEAGFSLIELLFALGITLIVLGAASTLMAGAFNIRRYEDVRSDGLADVRRALNTMSREIAVAGANLPAGVGLPSNGIVAANSDSQSIRVVSNLNASGGAAGNRTAPSDPNEDVQFAEITSGADRYVVRYDINSVVNRVTVLANRVDNMRIRYFDQKIDYTLDPANCNITLPAGIAESANKTLSKYVVISVCVTLHQVGTPGSPGYNPASQVQLTSDVMLRNSDLWNY